MKKLLVFDLNGTLSDDGGAQLIAVNAVLEALNQKEISLERLRETMSIPPSNLYITNGCNSSELEVRGDELGKLFFSVFNRELLEVVAIKNAVKVLNWLKEKEIPFVILTNYPRKGNEKFLCEFFERLGFGDFFNSLLAISGNEKYGDCPKLKLLNYYLESHPEHEEIVMIGDGLEEIEIAEILKGVSIAFTSGYYSRKRLESAGADYVIDDLIQIKNII